MPQDSELDEFTGDMISILMNPAPGLLILAVIVGNSPNSCKIIASEDTTSPQINQVHFIKIVIRQRTYTVLRKNPRAGSLGITVQGTDNASIDAGQLQLTREGQLTLLQCDGQPLEGSNTNGPLHIRKKSPNLHAKKLWKRVSQVKFPTWTFEDTATRRFLVT